ncbi:8-oxo-dGTP pyrophosphatase MutT (NUDIX family) [Rhodobacteraceae bacterium MBR-64]|jgi:8-oxo-dGTP pyrophosphatase MutT (NUDIX family)
MTRPDPAPASPDKSAIRDAATILVVRDAAGPTPSVLMGQRGKSAAFMPGKFVFPGGAVDRGDHDMVLAHPLPAPCDTRIGPMAGAIAAAAIRELWEETGLALARPGHWQPAAGWEAFAERGLVPAADGLRFVFRAITPPGRPRRFDARFLLADASSLAGDPDDFSQASDELNHLQWVPLAEARSFDLPFITEVVLAEVVARLPSLDAPERVAFFDNSGAVSRFHHID